MANILKKASVVILVISVVLMTFLAILSIWDFLQKDVLQKSLTTIGVVGFAALVVLLAAKYVEDKNLN
ncbi:MAG: hypothetical protein WC587_01925 [Candidatus Paceibacterota bacterium]